MRVLVMALFAAACASAPTPPANERVAGCWIDRGQNRTVTMRWLRGGEPGILNGQLLEYGMTGAISRRASYTLAPRDGRWTLCEVGAVREESQCYAVAEGDTGSLEGGRVFIDSHREELRIAVVGANGAREVLFDGRRDGCD